jgi:2,4-dienoyl-CoA reductase (NADPH2)
MALLFTPGNIHHLTLKNRIIMPAMHLNFAEAGHVSEKMLAFYRERAKGGVALIMIGLGNTDPRVAPGGFLDISQDLFLPGLKRLVETVQSHDCRIGVQLAPASYYGDPLHLPGSGELPLIREQMILAAERARRAGFDLVEILGSGGSLISYLLSPAYNKSIPGYSGSMAERLRHPLEIIQGARQILGPDFPLSIRIHGSEFLPDGYSLREAVRHAKEFATAGVNVINVTGGGHRTYVPQITMEVPRGCYAYLAREVRRQVDVPVIASNRINTPQLAEELLRYGYADFINMGRALISDPALPSKARRQAHPEITACVACNRCIDHVFEQRPLACTVNPLAGQEFLGDLTPAPQSRRIYVAGAGPAGMTAARILATRGHQVTIFEKAATPGGKLIYASQPPERQELRSILDFLPAELRRLRVPLHLETELTQAMVAAKRPDVLIIASGARDVIPDLPGLANVPWLTFRDVYQGRAKLGENIVIIGGGGIAAEVGHFIARGASITPEILYFLTTRQALPSNATEALLEPGRNITLLKRGVRWAENVGKSSRWTLIQELKRLKVNMFNRCEYQAFAPNGVTIRQNGRERFIPADTIILATGASPDQQLAEACRAIVPSLHIIGDARQVGNLYSAIHDGFAIAQTI